jgi:hypothetical protein
MPGRVQSGEWIVDSTSPDLHYPLPRYPLSTSLCRTCGTSLAGRPPQTHWCPACRQARKAASHRAWRQRVRGVRPRRAVCERCQAAPIAGERVPEQPHANARYCTPCRDAIRRRPRSRVTPAQADALRPLLNTMPVLQICAQVGISKAAYQRWRMEAGISLRNDAYRPDVVEAVLRTYEQAPPGQGKAAVREAFPDVRVRSIVEGSRAFAPRQIRWTDEQIREAAKMAGLVSHSAQARYFGRPHTGAGSVKSLWVKRFGYGPSEVNSFGIDRAWQLVQYGCPAVLVQRLKGGMPIAKVLWLDMIQWLKPEVADEVRECVQALARWQAWLHGTMETGAIRRMIQEREQQYGNADPRDDERAGARNGTRGTGHRQCQIDCADT